MTSDSVRTLQACARFLYDELDSEIANRNWRLPPRPWSEFMDKFTTPERDATLIRNRIALNSHLYQANYCIILGIALLYYILCHPASLFVVGCIMVAWVYATSPKPIIINGRRITRHQRIITLAVGSLVILVFSGILFSTIRVLFLSVFVIVVHASLRHASLRQKVDEIRKHTVHRW